MGWKYEVSGWTYGDPLGIDRPDWHYAPVYRGQSLLAALWAMAWARDDYGCIKLECR